MPGLAADRVSRIVLGLHAAALAGVHGAFALHQGAVALAGPLFSAIGPPCEPTLAWHACLPALTLAPDLRTAALLTLAVAAITAAAAAAASLPVRSNPGAAPRRPPANLGSHGSSAPGTPTSRLARAWPWALAAFLAWGFGGWWLGAAANDALVRLGGATFLLDLALPLAVAVTARARVHRPALPIARR